MDVTTWLAICGTITGAIALGWNIGRDLRDCAKLTLSAYIGKRVRIGTGELQAEDLQDRFILTMTNVGRRPIWLTSWGGMRSKSAGKYRGFLMPCRVLPILPRVLGEGDYCFDDTTDFSVLSRDVQEIHVTDSTYRKWRLKKKTLRRLQARAKEMGLIPDRAAAAEEPELG